MDVEVTGARARLKAHLIEAGALRDPAWIRCFDAVDRSAFVPATCWALDDSGRRHRLCRGDDELRWYEAVWQDAVVVTQVEGDEEFGPPTSSCSMPSVVFSMLDKLAVADGMRVLEIGTGTGYNAALLCERLGERSVTTVEIDPEIASQARRALAAAGYHPRVVGGDGVLGYPPAAPYDRIIATCAVRWLPAAWAAQLAPSGMALVPWDLGYMGIDALVRLRPLGDGSLAGPVVDVVSFLLCRSQRVTRAPFFEFVRGDAESIPQILDFDGELTRDADAEFAVAVHLHGVDVVPRADDTGQTLWLLDPSTGSWAAAGPGEVRQHGPRRLWQEVVDAYRWWLDADRPSWNRFGLTVTPQGRHIVWLDAPTNPVTTVDARETPT